MEKQLSLTERASRKPVRIPAAILRHKIPAWNNLDDSDSPFKLIIGPDTHKSIS